MSHDHPCISVLLPIYNGGKYLEDALQSVLGQKDVDLEVLAVNDGSTDNSAQTLESWAQKDARLRVLTHQRSQGICVALNYAAANAKAGVLARMDADDVAYAGRLKGQLQWLKENPHIVAGGTWVRRIDPQGRSLGYARSPLSNDAIRDALKQGQGTAIVHPTLIIRRAAFEMVGGYDDAFRYIEDLDLYLKLMEIGQLGNLAAVGLDYRQHLESANAQRFSVQLSLRQKRLSKVDGGDPSRLPRTQEEPARRWARWALQDGERRVGLVYALLAWWRKAPKADATRHLWAHLRLLVNSPPLPAPAVMREST